MQKKVLVVDDSSLARKIAVEYLRSNGFDALDCETPFEVLHKLNEFMPDVVLLDMNMPGLSGGSVAEVIRKHITFGDIRIVMFSSIDEKRLRKYLDNGLADACFTKTDSLSGLSETINGVFSRTTH